MYFKNRSDAGKQLAQLLEKYKDEEVVLKVCTYPLTIDNIHHNL